MRRLALALASLLAAPAARAELAVLANGQVLKVVSQRREAGLVTLGLPGGGELGLPEQAVRGVLADEIVEDHGLAGVGQDVGGVAEGLFAVVVAFAASAVAKSRGWDHHDTDRMVHRDGGRFDPRHAVVHLAGAGGR